MLTLQTDALQMVRSPEPRRVALDLFRRTQTAGRLRRAWLGLRGGCGGLRVLAAAGRGGQRALGRQTVAITQIVGSEGRAGDFDGAFAPLGAHTRDRWVSVATARWSGKTLPPVQLIRAADGYYVRDGHHRISVARAFGEEFVEAEVVSWE
jgi:hypothetical protein